MPNYSNGRGGRRFHSRRRRHRALSLPLLLGALLLALLVVALAFFLRRPKRNGPAASASDAGQSVEDTTVAKLTSEDILADAAKKAAQYDYDAAIAAIEADETTAQSEAGQAAITKYNEIKGTLVRQDPQKITHVFFHTLIMDNKKAFDGDSRQNGYNDVMTTKSEFEKMMQSMYDKGYVLVRIHDVAYEVDDPETGGKKMVWGDIMLPPGKTAFVLSQDDVNYYEYMNGDGFAKDIIVGPNGKPMNEMVMEDGSVSVGAYDLIPILDEFIEKHPDFSYRGAKGIIAVTGYNGVFGYRTDPSYEGKNPNIEADRQKVREVAQCLRDDGWELASHSWGHRNYGKIPFAELEADNQKWQDYVGELIGGTDILLFPFGADVGDWHPYKDDNERFRYLHNSGFRYFCNVDSNQYYVQKGQDYLRQGRRNLDGYRLWQDMTVKNHTSDLFNASDIFDSDRPTPVPDYKGG